MTIYRFRFGEVFPADDQLAQWVGTLALAFNDLALVHVELDQAFSGPAHVYLYKMRMALGHFNEAGEYLSATSAIPVVREYVDSLPKETRALYGDCLTRHRSRKGVLARVRNHAAFHYPELKIGAAAKRQPIQVAFRELAGEYCNIYKAPSGTIGKSRLLFADDIVSRLFVHGAEDDEELVAAHREIGEAIQSFMRFANAALDEWWARARSSGVRFGRTPGGPGSYDAPPA